MVIVITKTMILCNNELVTVIEALCFQASELFVQLLGVVNRCIIRRTQALLVKYLPVKGRLCACLCACQR